MHLTLTTMHTSYIDAWFKDPFSSLYLFRVYKCMMLSLSHPMCSHIHPNSGVMIKLDLQLYQIDPKNYLLDFKCVNPGQWHLCVWLCMFYSVHVQYSHVLCDDGFNSLERCSLLIASCSSLPVCFPLWNQIDSSNINSVELHVHV